MKRLYIAIYLFISFALTIYAQTKLPATVTKSGTSVSVIQVVSGGTEGIIDPTDDGKSLNGHDYVEIGGVKWATMNLGAKTVAGSIRTSAGDYYAWGATEPWYSSLTWKTDSVLTITWKAERSSGGYTGDNAPFYDNTTRTATKYLKTDGGISLELADDAAHVNWGGSWRMPTYQDFKNLFTACGVSTPFSNPPVLTSSKKNTKGVYWLRYNQKILPEYTGVSGALFILDENHKLFFPACGAICYHNGLYDKEKGKYWTSTSITTYDGQNFVEFNSGAFRFWGCIRSYGYGYTIRPVAD